MPSWLLLMPLSLSLGYQKIKISLSSPSYKFQDKFTEQPLEYLSTLAVGINAEIGNKPFFSLQK
jgi:hypothetical protein